MGLLSFDLYFTVDFELISRWPQDARLTSPLMPPLAPPLPLQDLRSRQEIVILPTPVKPSTVRSDAQLCLFFRVLKPCQLDVQTSATHKQSSAEHQERKLITRNGKVLSSTSRVLLGLQYKAVLSVYNSSKVVVVAVYEPEIYPLMTNMIRGPGRDAN